MLGKCEEEKNINVIHTQAGKVIFVDLFNSVKAGIEISSVLGQWRDSIKFTVIAVHGGAYASAQKAGWKV